MPSYTINTDTLTALQPYTNASTIQAVLENTIFQVAGIDYRRQFGSADLNDALADYLAAVQENRAIGIVRQIRAHAVGLLAAGVATPGAGGKLIASNQDNIDTLTVAAALTAGQIGALSLPATDGTRWPINTPARATTALTTINSRISAVNGVRDSSISSYQALTPQQKRNFQFSSIVWPA